jgi:hypothetical protein
LPAAPCIVKSNIVMIPSAPGCRRWFVRRPKPHRVFVTEFSLLGFLYWDFFTGISLLGFLYWDFFTGFSLPG